MRNLDKERAIVYLAHKNKSGDIPIDKLLIAAKELNVTPTPGVLTLTLIWLEKISAFKLTEYQQAYERITRS